MQIFWRVRTLNIKCDKKWIVVAIVPSSAVVSTEKLSIFLSNFTHRNCQDFFVLSLKMANSKCQLYINFMIYYVVDIDTSHLRVDFISWGISDFILVWHRNRAHKQLSRRRLGKLLASSRLSIFFSLIHLNSTMLLDTRRVNSWH